MARMNWNFDYSYSCLPNVLFSKTSPRLFPHAKLLLFNDHLATELGLNISSLSEEEVLKTLLGNNLPSEAIPLAQAYAGHQYGYFTILGDGRAILLGEHVTHNQGRVDIHLKGAGKTAYARQGDGNAVLKPMLREYMISEAMHALNIPTTRSLAVIGTGETVRREKDESGAVLVRVASSHIRIGTFQFAALQQDKGALKELLYYTIKRHCPELLGANNPALALLQHVIHQQAKLIVEWMRDGFIHGVMNTDNMAISGETIDYGPCAFMDQYDPNTVFSSIDREGRYAFGNQAYIAQWNLARFAESLLTLLDHNHNKAIELAEEAISSFNEIYYQLWLAMMRKKLGLLDEESSDSSLIHSLLNLMQQFGLDYTNTFFDLTYSGTLIAPLESHSAHDLHNWLILWNKRKESCSASEASQHVMQLSNPVVIPRNHIVESVLKSADEGNNLEPLKEFLSVLNSPYQLGPSTKKYQQLPLDHEKVYQTFCGT